MVSDRFLQLFICQPITLMIKSLIVQIETVYQTLFTSRPERLILAKVVVQLVVRQFT